jgi:hypothetical protein
MRQMVRLPIQMDKNAICISLKLHMCYRLSSHIYVSIWCFLHRSVFAKEQTSLLKSWTTDKPSVWIQQTAEVFSASVHAFSVLPLCMHCNRMQLYTDSDFLNLKEVIASLAKYQFQNWQKQQTNVHNTASHVVVSAATNMGDNQVSDMCWPLSRKTKPDIWSPKAEWSVAIINIRTPKSSQKLSTI